MTKKAKLAALRGKRVFIYQYGASEPEEGVVGIAEESRVSLVFDERTTRWFPYARIASVHTSEADEQMLAPFKGTFLQLHLKDGNRTTRGTMIAVQDKVVLMRHGPGEVKNIPIALIAGVIVT